MNIKQWSALGLAGVLLVSYNLTQPGLRQMRNSDAIAPGTTNTREGYGPSLEWLDRLALASRGEDSERVKLDFSVMSSLMVAGLASGFKSQVANLLWMKSDEYWHQGLFTRQVPLMEAVVTLDPQFIDAWSTAGWHWAYNIFADIPLNPDYKNRGPEVIQAAQDNAIETGLDYLDRGSQLNPDTYRLWFEHGWTRAEKAGIYDDKTLELYRTARKQSDAREIEIAGPGGEMKKEEGIDLMGRTIGHLLESIPRTDQALDHYATDLMELEANGRDRQLLDKAATYWKRYGSEYPVIVDVYNAGDAVQKAQVKALVPDIEQLVEAHEARQRISTGDNGGNSQPVGAYVSIAARYKPAHDLAKQGRYEEAIAQLIGVMNADTKHHLQGLPVMRRIYALRGDVPAAIEKNIENLKATEITSSQDIGLHLLASLYEDQADKLDNAGNEKRAAAFHRLAFETWVRARERNSLNYYARRQARLAQEEFGFKEPQNVIDEIKKSRKGGTPNAAPSAPPNVSNYYR